MMKLHGYFRSSASFRVRIALALKGIEAERAFVHLPSGEQRAPDFLETNPQGFVPALAVDGALLTQSLAIIEYLDETHPEPKLLPQAAIDRAMVRAMAQIIACDIHPINNLRILKYLKNPLGQSQEAVDDWYRHWIVSGFEPLEALVAKHGGGYCFGDRISLADVCLAPQIWNARRFATDLAPFPNLVRIDAVLKEHPAFKAAAPENQPDAA